MDPGHELPARVLLRARLRSALSPHSPPHTAPSPVPAQPPPAPRQTGPGRLGQGGLSLIPPNLPQASIPAGITMGSWWALCHSPAQTCPPCALNPPLLSPLQPAPPPRPGTGVPTALWHLLLPGPCSHSPLDVGTAQLSPPVPLAGARAGAQGDPCEQGQGAEAVGAQVSAPPGWCPESLRLPAPLCPSLAVQGVWCGAHPAQFLHPGTRVWGSSCALHALSSPFHVFCRSRGCWWGRFWCRSTALAVLCRSQGSFAGLGQALALGAVSTGLWVLEGLGWAHSGAGGTGAAGFGGAVQCWGEAGPGWVWLGWDRHCSAPGGVLLGLAQVGLGPSRTGGSSVGFGQFFQDSWCRCCGGPGWDCFCSHCLGAL